MIKYKIFYILFLFTFLIKPLSAKEPSKLIKEIVDEASIILSSSDPVESKIIKLNNIAEINVDIDGIGMYTLGAYRKTLNEDQKEQYKKLFKEYRQKKRLTQEELALKVGVSRQTIISIERYRYKPSLELGMKIASSLKTKIDVLFYFE